MTLNSLSPAESISLSFLDTSRFNQTPKLPGFSSPNLSLSLGLKIKASNFQYFFVMLFWVLTSGFLWTVTYETWFFVNSSIWIETLIVWLLQYLSVLKFTSLGVVVTGGFSLRKKRTQGRGFVGKGVKCSVKVQQQQQQPPPPPAWPGRAVPEPPRQSWDGPKPISIVGSTGSIGTQVLFCLYALLPHDF